MAAKTMAPVEALPQHPPLSGAWPPPTRAVEAPPVLMSGDAKHLTVF